MRARALLSRAAGALLLVATAGSPAGATTAGEARPECRAGHGYVESPADGARIAYTLFLPSGASTQSQVPVVLMTHGFTEGERARSLARPAPGQTYSAQAAARAAALVDAGYAVLTWDQRGYAESGGEMDFASQTSEVRDVQGLLDEVAKCAQIRLDAPGDPSVGLVGGSYGGSILLMTAAADPRIDAVAAANVYWDLLQTLRPNGSYRRAWLALLVPAAASKVAVTPTGVLVDDVAAGRGAGAFSAGWRDLSVDLAADRLSDSTRQWLTERSPRFWADGGRLGDRVLPGIAAPVLLVGGSVDNLTVLNEAIAAFEHLRAKRVPTALRIWCTGHTVPLTGKDSADACGSTTWVEQQWRGASLGWLDQHLRGGPPLDAMVQYHLQNDRPTTDGSTPALHELHRLPQRRVHFSGAAELMSTAVPTSGAGSIGPQHPCPGDNPACGVRIPIATSSGQALRPGDHLLGAGRVRVRVTSAGEASVFLRILEVAADGVRLIGNQEVPLRVAGSGTRDVEIELPAVSWRIGADRQLALEVSPTSLQHSTSPVPGPVAIELEGYLTATRVEADRRPPHAA